MSRARVSVTNRRVASTEDALHRYALEDTMSPPFRFHLPRVYASDLCYARTTLCTFPFPSIPPPLSSFFPFRNEPSLMSCSVSVCPSLVLTHFHPGRMCVCGFEWPHGTLPVQEFIPKRVFIQDSCEGLWGAHKPCFFYMLHADPLTSALYTYISIIHPILHSLCVFTGRR